MATKAEIEAELADLKAKMAEAEPAATRPGGTPEPDEPATAWADLLKSQGIDPGDLETLWQQLSEELGDLPQNKPLLTAIGAFGLGFALGRMSK